MIPFILVAVGGYLVGNSFDKSNPNIKFADGGRMDDDILLERYSKNENSIRGLIGNSTFFAPEGEGNIDYGNKKTNVLLLKSAKIYKCRSSYDFAIENNLLNTNDSLVKKITGLNTLEEVAQAYHNGISESGANKEFQKNPNLYFNAFQEVAERELKKQGYDGAKWSSEDDLNPTQYQIWNNEVIKLV